MTNNFTEVNEREQKAIVGICILAAFADGAHSELERGEIKRIVDNFSNPEFDLTSAYQQALSGNLDVGKMAAELQSPNAKLMVYEMAVCTCLVDKAIVPAEQRFLDGLRGALKLDAGATSSFQQTATAISTAPLPPPIIADHRDAELDKMILNRAILAGALELMPQTLATMAIVPVQMRLVYQIGANYGFKLDMGHAKEFLATVGVGMASQVVEGYLTRFVGKLTKKFAGRIVSGLLTQATESALAFATTYAIGQAAKRYYASGRTLSTAQLQDVFSSMLGQGRALNTQYLGEITQKASQIRASDLLGLVKQS